VPASAALLLSRRLGRVLLLAALISATATLAGLGISFAADLPTNQTLCATACALLALIPSARAPQAGVATSVGRFAAYTAPGATVLDGFGGSGSTGLSGLIFGGGSSNLTQGRGFAILAACFEARGAPVSLAVVRADWEGADAMSKVERPFFPIVYVRGYAMTQGEIAETVVTPYMGFKELWTCTDALSKRTRFSEQA